MADYDLSNLLNVHEKSSTFSGTDKCECGGKVVYNCKRSDGAELGGCLDCGRPYSDLNGNRMRFNWNQRILF